MPDNERLEREIEEILGKIENFPEPQARARRARKRRFVRVSEAFRQRQRQVAQQLSRIAVSQIMLASFVLILFSFFFRRANPVLMNWVMYAGIILFVSSFAIVMFSGRRGGSTVRQNWRGRPTEYRTTPSLADRVRRWWQERNVPRR
ncbi:MAG: hypothetical protein Q8M79_01605 [Dehalococcoidia bacterium]|nr:hypothetical protein [Dehalococcoidia bacterium]